MNALKHMELIFGVVVVAGCVAAAMPAERGAPALPEAARPAAAQPAVPIVVVKGKRMTALEKRTSIGADAVSRDAAAGT